MLNNRHVKLFSLLCLVIISELSKYADGVEKDEDKNVENYFFHPVSELQPLENVLRGPYISNLATAEREAKLVDSNEDPGAKSERLVSVIEENVLSHEDSIKEKLLPNDALSKEDLRDVLSKSDDGYENISTKELKKELGDLKPKKKTDSELINHLKEKYNGLKTQLAVNKVNVPILELYDSGNIVVGAGYSSDSQQVVPQICYNATVSSTSNPQGYIQLDTAVSYSEVETLLGITVGISGMFEMFSAGAAASYVRSIQDNDYSISFNYYESAMNNVAVQLAGYGEEALTKSGKGFYNGGKNPYFGLFCGDNYISSYQQGALLTMGLNLKFSSSLAKNEFIEKAGISFGSIISATEEIKIAASNHKITGSIVIQAFQIGGDPIRLAKILNKDGSGQYYALTCSLTEISNCIKAASGLLDYAKSDFSSQISFKNNIGLTPIGNGFTEFTPIERIGLTPPVSLVTEEVIKYRDELSTYLKENEYYKEKLYPFLNHGYPVELDTIFMSKIISLFSKVSNNTNLLMAAHNGAADCFNLPDKCKNIKSRIASQLKNITVDELDFLYTIKYTVTTLGGLFYNIGYDSGSSWRGVTHQSGGYILAKVRDVSITGNSYFYHIDINKPGISGLFEYTFQGYSATPDGLAYEGPLCYYPKTCRYLKETKEQSPFYFEPYSDSR